MKRSKFARVMPRRAASGHRPRCNCRNRRPRRGWRPRSSADCPRRRTARSIACGAGSMREPSLPPGVETGGSASCRAVLRLRGAGKAGGKAAPGARQRYGEGSVQNAWTSGPDLRPRHGRPNKHLLMYIESLTAGSLPPAAERLRPAASHVRHRPATRFRAKIFVEAGFYVSASFTVGQAIRRDFGKPGCAR